MPFTQGDLVRLDGIFKTAAGVLLDPTAVSVTIVRPDGQRNTYTYVTDADVVKDTTGTYHINVNASIPGTWRYWWHSTGTGQAGAEESFIVRAAKAADAPDKPATLGVDYGQLQRHVGRLLGLGRNPGDWDSNAREDVADIIRSGLRRFYWPPPLPAPDGKPSPPAYSWSFLTPNATLELKTGVDTYILPDNFGEMLDGNFIYISNQQAVAKIDHMQIHQMQSQSAASGPPKYAGIEPVDDRATRYQVMFYPTPDADYSLTYHFTIAPKDLSEESPFPLGGPVHAETIIEACLAAAEKTLDDAEGIHENKFLECLARSIQSDRNLTQTDEDYPWPLENAASDLGITKAYLKRLVGRQLGYGPHPAVWSHKQGEEVKLALETGLRKFYAPQVLPGEKYSHEWSFLRPTASLFSNSNTYIYDLPPGFVSIDGPLTLAPAAGYMYPPIEVVGEHQIRVRLQASEAAGRPRLAAVRLKPIDPAGGTHWEILLWPPPDNTYQLTYRYNVNPAMIPDEANLPYGGQQHAQTIIEACLAAAEEQGETIEGAHGQLFVQALIASVSLDRRTGSPEKLGYNRDASDRPLAPYVPFVNWHDCDTNLVSYNDQLY